MLPDPALFDITDVAQIPLDGMLERVELEHLLPAPNPRRDISQESIQQLAAL